MLYGASIPGVLQGADAVMILTEWEEIKSLDKSFFKNLMNKAIIFDGRNCFDLESMGKYDIEYYSVGRPAIKKTF